MLVQALAEYADTYLAEQLGDPAFEEKPVQYAIEIDEGGAFVGVRERTVEVPASGKRRAQVRALPLSVPKSPVARNSSEFPLIGCDAVQYLLGPNLGVWTEQDELEKHTRQHQAFARMMSEAAAACDDVVLKSCIRFIGDAAQNDKARAALGALRPRPGALAALSQAPRRVEPPEPGGPIVERPAIRQYWRVVFEAAFAGRVQKGGEGMCLVSGTHGPIVPTHDKVKGAGSLGGQPAGVALMSFDKPAFRSYGWDKNLNSPVSPNRATAYVLALNDLMLKGEHRRGLSKDKIVRTRIDLGALGLLFWTRKPTDDDWHALLFEAVPEQVAALLAAPLTGNADVVAEPNDFYFVGVAGNGGRLVVRHWSRETLAATKASVRSWFAGLRVADVFANGRPVAAPPVWALLCQLARDPKDVPPERALQMVRRALLGVPLGRAILAAALGRLRLAKGNELLNATRIGLIKLCVNDLAEIEGKGAEPMTESLDSQNEHPAYVCGRLLAVYDGLQYEAQGEVGVTVVDRYFALASTNPQVAFPKIEDLGIRHMKKLRRDKPRAAGAIQRRLAELHEALARQGGKFPGQLGLEDQGRFAIGFHHQKADDARRREEAKAKRVSEIDGNS